MVYIWHKYNNYLLIGLSHLVTMDLYHKEIQGFFDFPVDNLRCSPFLIQYITSHVSVPFTY